MEYQSGKCRCMDREQLFLLQCLMEAERTSNINIDECCKRMKQHRKRHVDISNAHLFGN